MYQRIIVGTDGSERATGIIDHAAELAKLCNAELHIVEGCGSPVVMAPMAGAVAAIDPRETVTACTSALEPIADRLRLGGLSVEIHVLAESGQAALIDVAEQIGADLIVVGNRGMTGARRFLGSVPASISHHAPCSVLIAAT